MRPIIMDFSGIYREEDFWEGQEPVWLDFQELQGVNGYCAPEAETAIKGKIRDLPVRGIHFLDSGNYHYLSKFWLEKLREPFSLLVFDNHTDMQEA
ncbi:MAG TPA: arginase, partial [Candidatus Blautia pullistercoris]|nr:arginase [Candidatus Blautia pullistercoris]